MQRQVCLSAGDGEWITVSPRHPCAVCGAHEGCRNGYEGRFACCLRRASVWPLTPGGWLHRLDGDPERSVVEPLEPAAGLSTM